MDEQKRKYHRLPNLHFGLRNGKKRRANNQARVHGPCEQWWVQGRGSAIPGGPYCTPYDYAQRCWQIFGKIAHLHTVQAVADALSPPAYCALGIYDRYIRRILVPSCPLNELFPPSTQYGDQGRIGVTRSVMADWTKCHHTQGGGSPETPKAGSWAIRLVMAD